MSETSRRDFGKQVATVLGSTAFMPRTAEAGVFTRRQKKPNIVFICSDQHSYKYNGFSGHPLVKTPNLDRIACQGVVFSNTYCASPGCVPARTSMMTGMYPSDCNSFCNATVWDGKYPIWGTHLKRNGYYCRAIGKMDLNDDFSTGFEEIETPDRHSR